MKRTSLAFVLATLAIVPSIAWSQARAESPVVAQTSGMSVAQNMQNMQGMDSSSMVMSGKFMAGEHPTQGDVQIIMENGRSYLELGSNFMSEMGPDLKVVLHRSTQPGLKFNSGDYVVLGSLQKTSGMQRYMIPNNVNLTDYHSAAVWCQRFNANFGWAMFN